MARRGETRRGTGFCAAAVAAVTAIALAPAAATTVQALPVSAATSVSMTFTGPVIAGEKWLLDLTIPGTPANAVTAVAYTVRSGDTLAAIASGLRAAVAAGAWPKLKTARGKFLFAMDEGPAKTDLYRGARKSLEGRVMFVNVDETSPAAGYITLNAPKTQAARIAAAVKAGLIVRTRADADTVEARTNDHSTQTAAFASGAHYVSTDYMTVDTRLSTYEAHLPGDGVARLNPVVKP